MNKHNKHTPLTAEELVKLLDIHSNNEPNLTELDDFEKEALEGFSAHTSAETAKDLMNEVQAEISKKVSASSIIAPTQESDSKKYKIIWFSAAASLLLIVALSILFINKSTIESEQSIALNETKLKPEGAPPIPSDISTIIRSETTPDSKQIETNTNERITNYKKQNGPGEVTSTLPLKELEQNQKKSESFGGKYRQSNNSGTNAIASGNGLVNGSVATKQDKTNDFETLETTVDVKKTLADAVTSVPASAKSEEVANTNLAYEKSTKAKDESKKEATKNQPIVAAESKLDVGYADGDKTEADTKSYAGIAQNTSSTMAAQTTPAYFKGSEIAIKEYILTYHKKTNSTQKLQGSFLIKAKVLSNGTLKVTSINNVSKDYSECKDFLKEALNSMKDWNPALKNGVKTDSDTHFMLMF